MDLILFGIWVSSAVDHLDIGIIVQTKTKLRFLTVSGLVGIFLLSAGCSPRSETIQEEIIAAEAPQPKINETTLPLAKYLYVWARDKGLEQTDFFSVFDVDPDSTHYGQLLSTVPMGMVANAHHTEHFMPEGKRLCMDGFKSGNSFVVKVADPGAPVIEAHFTNAGPYTYPHSFERLPNGNVLSTFQNMGAQDSGPGGAAGARTGHWRTKSY
jgi:hypothetical protein